jgi:hypothetical protein
MPPHRPAASGRTPFATTPFSLPLVMTSLAFRRASVLALAIALALFVPPPAAAQDAPRFRDVAGHDFGERITLHADVVRYLERLAAASPRVQLVDQGRSWQGRRLLLAIVTSPENHARIAEIRANAERLGDARTLSPAEADALVARQPAIAWLGGSIHGFELSGSEAVLMLVERLTTTDDAATRAILENVVLLLDPMLNPDGRDAFANINHEYIGRVPSSRAEDWSNDFTGWQALRFRTGHYYFDTNRDWFAHTQRETRARVPTLLAWRPQVLIDLHEMGPDVEFYFDPPGEPYGPFFPDFARTWFTRFGEAHARAFDEAGYQYMTRERYNFFYPGYTTSFGSYQGAVGMLYEQGSTRGLRLARPDGSVRTLRDAADQQFTAAWAAMSLTARERATLLRDYHAAQRAAIAAGGRGVRRYVIAGGAPDLVAELVALLRRNGIEVGELVQSAQLGGVRDRAGSNVGTRTFAPGSFVIEAAQPHNRLIRALLEPDQPLPEEFLALARHYVERDQNPRFYDITAWSLPLFFNLDVYGTTDARALNVRAVADTVVRYSEPARAAYAYVIDGRQPHALAVLYHLMDGGHRAAMTIQPTRIAGRDIPSGSVVVRIGQNEPAVHDAVRELARRYGVRVDAFDSGHSEIGFPALGSADVIPVRKPAVAIVAEDPVQAYSFGWAWYTLDRQYEIPVTVLRAGSLANARLDRFDTIVLPELNGAAFARLLGEDGVERLRRWVRDGGTLVTIGGATDFARQQLDLIALRSWYDEGEATDAQRFAVPGAFFVAGFDRGAWLSAGYDAEAPFFINSNRLYRAPEGPPSARRRVVARVADGQPRVSGHAWPESLARLPGSVLVYEERVGAGRVIAFAEDVNFRAYNRGLNRLFLNAVVVGASAP